MEMRAMGIRELVSLQRAEVCGDLPAAVVTKGRPQGWGRAGRCGFKLTAHGRVQSAGIF